MGGLRVDIPRMLYMLRIKDASLRVREWWAPCPNPKHHEKEPSWSIQDDPDSERHGHHYCFGCEWGGGPVELVSARIGITHMSAKRWLIENGLVIGGGGTLPDFVVNVLSPIRPVPSLPEGVVIGRVEGWPMAAWEYAEARGITPEQVDLFRLGIATSGRLTGRIVLPAYDRYGRVTNYTARTYTGQTRRYLNPKKEDGYPEHLSVFGEHLWRMAKDRVVVVSEGAINTLAAYSATGLNVGGLFGSHIKPGQILKLARFDFVVILEDPDPKGREFAEQLEASLKTATRVAVAKMPDGGDPAEQPKDVLGSLICDAISRMTRS